jgi:ferredoxin
MKIIKPSTRAFISEALKTPGYGFIDLLHGYVYARWPYLYISIGKGEHPLSPKIAQISSIFQRIFHPHKNSNSGQGKSSREAFADTYHGKVLPLKSATQLVSVNEPVSITNLERIIPYNLARDIVLRNPDHIVAMECPCRAAKQDFCQPLDVCLIVGEPFASFVAEHHPQRSRWINSGEAISILRAEEESGHVHHAFFKDAMFGRFYAICNCCACCCGAMGAQRRGTPMLASSGYTSQVEEELCIGCGDCIVYCQFDALTLDNGYARINQEVCMGCGNCVSHCEQEALLLIRNPAKGEPLEIERLIQEVAEKAPLAA